MVEIVTEHGDASFVLPEQTDQDFLCRRLAGATRPEKSEDFALFNVKN